MENNLQIQVDLGENHVPTVQDSHLVKVNIPQLVDQDGRQVLGLMTGHQQQPVNQAAILENQNQNVVVPGDQTALILPHHYQRLNGLTVDIQQFIQISGVQHQQQQQQILPNNQ